MVALSTPPAPKKGKSPYRTIIVKSLLSQGLHSVEPRLIEGYLRLQYGTLDHLDRETFDREVKLAVLCVNTDPHGAEELARSYGL